MVLYLIGTKFMTTNPGKGGRGKRAPYESIHYRIPTPIKPVVEMLAEAYRQLLDTDLDPKGEKLLRQTENAIAIACYPSDAQPANQDSYCTQELEKLQLQLENLKRVEQLSHEQITQLTADQLQVASILKEALKLKANAGGAIKEKIKEALKLIDD